jgi:hypothetical protein
MAGLMSLMAMMGNNKDKAEHAQTNAANVNPGVQSGLQAIEQLYA